MARRAKQVDGETPIDLGGDVASFDAADFPSADLSTSFTIDSAAPTPAKVNRISIPLSDDGAIDFGAMRQGTAAKVKAAIKKTNISDGSVSLFTKTNTDAIYDILGGMEAQVFARTMKLDREIANRVFPYSEQEKQLLAGPTIELLNKRAPAAISDNVDIITLVGLLLQLTQAKIALARELQLSHRSVSPFQPVGATATP